MYIGVDLGTSSIKLLLADKDGSIIDFAGASYPLILPGGNMSEQQPELWWEGFVSCLRNLGERHDLSLVRALSFSGQMHGLVLLDKDDRVIRPAILWNDGRTVEQCEYLNNDIGIAKLVSMTGNKALTGFTAPKLMWVRENEPENFAAIEKIMLPKDYLAYRLSGVFATDVSDASGTLYFDTEHRRWSEPMLELLGISPDKLPHVFESADVIGCVRADVAGELGLSGQCRVVIGGGDQAMGAVGTGTIEAGQMSISLGTSGVVFVCTDSFVRDDNASLHSFCHANGGYHLMGVTLACAASTKWWVEDVLSTEDYGAAFNGLAQLPIDERAIFLPYMIGERSPINDPGASGVFFGLNLEHDRRRMTKTVLEGICFSLADCLRVAREGGADAKSARVIGGGAKSADWLQMLADILGIELRTINTTEGGALGAVILAMTADGVFSSISQGCAALISDTACYKPRMEYAEKYAEKFKLYRKVYSCIRGI